MRKTISLALITLGLVAAPAMAGNYPPVPYMTAPVEAGTAPFNATIAAVNTNSTGLLYGLYAPVTATAAATTQTLGSYTIPASYLTNVGQTIRISGSYTTAANADNKTPVLTFGTYTYTGTTLSGAGAQSARYSCVITKTGASTQNAVCEGLSVVTPVAVTSASGTSPDTATIAINFQCTQGSAAADCTLVGATVESLR
jgi:hypothetical protein